MKNILGDNLTITLFGESHGKAAGAILDGMPPGIKVDEDFISHQLTLRRPAGEISTARVEKDNYEILSGVFNGYTTGTPLTISIPNADTRSTDYSERTARPSHADYSAFLKYHGYEDYRGGGHFSGRITSAIVAAAAVIISALRENGIHIATHIKHIAGIYDRDFDDYENDIKALSDKIFAVLDDKKGEAMQKEILSAKSCGDSVGGVLESVIINLPGGVGEPYFDSLESKLAHGIFSIPAVKGVEFGSGFDIAKMRGSQANDQMRNEGGKVKLTSLHSGGIYGGISVGEPIIVRTAIKPTPTIGLPQESVTLPGLDNATLSGKGRHDPCIVQRARVVIDSIIALTLADMLITRFGTDWMVKK